MNRESVSLPSLSHLEIAHLSHGDTHKGRQTETHTHVHTNTHIYSHILYEHTYIHLLLFTYGIILIP